MVYGVGCLQFVVRSREALTQPVNGESEPDFMNKNTVSNYIARNGRIKRLPLVFLALVALLGSMLTLQSAETEIFTGTAARTGIYKRPLLLVDGKRYELKASDNADASVAELLAKFSNGDTGSYALVGTRASVNGGDGILVDRIAPAAKPLPSAGVAASATKAVQDNASPAPAQITPAVTSSVVTVGSDRYMVCN